jgi:hypothetical protein
MANTNFSQQSSKSRRIKEFGEAIGQLSLSVYVSLLNVSLLYVVSQEVVSSRIMSHFLWKTGFLATKMALVLSHMRGTLSNLTPKSLMVCIIQRIYEQQLAAATYSTSMVDCSIEDCFREDQKMTSTRSVILVNPTTRKITIGKPTRSSEEEAEY